MKAIRIYTLKGCPTCEEVKKFIQGISLEFEEIEIGIDPIAQGGIKALVGNVQAPITISFFTNDVIMGNNVEKLNELADSVKQLRASAFNPTAK
jgi:glutaredoxin